MLRLIFEIENDEVRTTNRYYEPIKNKINTLFSE